MSKVFIGVPMHKGDVTATTMQSVSTATGKHMVNYQLLGLSLLAKNFNMLFISAIKKGYDFFVLHHSDLGVVGMATDKTRAGSWTDFLVDRLEEQKLAALSAAVAIKSDNGITSSGILTVEGDPWSLRRTTVKELPTLPLACVTRDDLVTRYGLDPKTAGALLINTGLLIMDIRNRGGIWREKKWPGFHIYDEIAWNLDGEPQSFTIPEDWNMSIWCHENNVPYAFTREFIVAHCGNKNYVNVGNWGDDTDCGRQQMSADAWRNSHGTHQQAI